MDRPTCLVSLSVVCFYECLKFVVDVTPLGR